MTHRSGIVLAAAALLLIPAASHAALSSYTQDFESLVQSDPAALQNDGWLVYGNVFTPAHVYMYGYGPFPAPNVGTAFCSIDIGQGGPEQGAQQLSVYSDYENLDHASGNLIESNVFQEQTIAAADVGALWTFQFDAKRGNLTGASTAHAFIKTLDPSSGYALTHFLREEMTSIPATWGSFALQLSIDASLVGQILQIGFMNTATYYEGSGIFYDNIYWSRSSADVVDGSPSTMLDLGAPVPNPFTSSMRIEYSLATRGIAEVTIWDIVGRRVATLFHGEVDPGPQAVTWDGRSQDGRLFPPGVYLCVLKTAAGRQARSLVLAR